MKGGDMSRTVVIGASSGLGRCIGVGLAQKGAQVALLARRFDRLERAAKEAGPEAVAIECDICDENSIRSADRLRRRIARRDRQPGLHPGHRPVGATCRYRCRHVAAGLRNQRDRRGAGDRGGGATPDGLGRQGGLPLLRRGHVRSAVARPRGVRGEQVGARATHRIVAGRAPGDRLHLLGRRRVRRR